MIDHRLLLLKYINFVGQMEGTTFIAPWTGPGPKEFTEEEWAELRALDKESLAL